MAEKSQNCGGISKIAAVTVNTKRKCCFTNIETQCKRFQSTPMVSRYKPRLCEFELPAPSWKLFTKQNDAIEYAKSADERLFVFGNEFGEGGIRNFVAATIEEFWFYYSQKSFGERHFYEVIQENAPCHLYFDVEFNKTMNPSKNGENMISIWIDYVGACLLRKFGLKLTRKCFLELESSSDVKYSQHLVVHMPQGCVFKDNIHAGRFVKKICKDLKEYLSLEPKTVPSDVLWIEELEFRDKLKDLVVKTTNGNGIFIDEGVYTRNRNFRLFMSRKRNKNFELKVSENCEFDFNQRFSNLLIFEPVQQKLGDDENSFKLKRIFFVSIVTNVCEDKVVKFLEIPAEKDEQQANNLSRNDAIVAPVTTYGLESSEIGIPTEEISEFITKYIKKFNQKARIRKLTYFPATRVINYDITGTRFCHNIGREHRNNNIMYVVDVTGRSCHQKCYDPDCRAIGYKSTSFPLPQEIDDIITCYEAIDQSEDAEKFKFSDKFEKSFDDCEMSDSDIIKAVVEFETNNN
ncbi:DNA-directed primase/polymerase protein-like [Ciona intestinalis]